MSEGFLTDLKTACLFYRFCQRYNIKNEQDRLAVMREITKRKKASYLRDVESFIKGKKTLFIKRTDTNA